MNRAKRFGWLLSVLWAAAACGRTPMRSPEIDAGVDAGEGGSAPALLEDTDKLDVLLVIDNTQTASYSHGLLAETVPYLLDRLRNPRCTNGLGQIVAETADPTAPCPVGLRDFAPVEDVHLAVLSTSIGGHGADSCSPASPSYDPSQDDHGHLLSRNPVGGEVPTYQGLGFLAWDPNQELSPPGEDDPGALTTALQALINGAGSKGCGFESQLESIYRFVVDPEPYETITVQNNVAQLEGIDTTVLQQRQAFLRPDSVLLIILLTDENDCSTREGGFYFLSNQAQNGSVPYHLPRARSECADDPEDPCCASCGQPAPAGCPETSPNCQLPPFTELEDPLNLRCWDQKRRFGVDFLYPVERYVDAFSGPTITGREGEVVDNPLWAAGRPPEWVVFTGIVGVPWQDLTQAGSSITSGYVPAAELDWRRLLADPTTGDPPTDPLMVESVEPRTGTHPVTGDPLAPPTAPSPTTQPINGHEHALDSVLQYACIYPLPFTQNCQQTDCECVDELIDTNPICQTAAGDYGAYQFYGRATPTTRPLRVLQALATHSVVTSICAPEVMPSESPGFAYRPAVDAMMRALRRKLRAADQ